VWSAGYASQQAVKDNNASVTAGGPGVLLSYTPSTEIETDSYRIFDLSFNYNINKMTIRGGITNLLNTEPVFTARTAGVPVGTNLSAICAGAPGCVNPGAYSLPNAVGGANAFNGGYYDTLGRRYFVGVNFNF
jgi:outer membrane receptor protein involved in Fe transport